VVPAVIAQCAARTAHSPVVLSASTALVAASAALIAPSLIPSVIVLVLVAVLVVVLPIAVAVPLGHLVIGGHAAPLLIIGATTALLIVLVLVWLDLAVSALIPAVMTVPLLRRVSSHRKDE
jgi:hypothetical protein